VIIEIMSFKREGVKKIFKTLGWTICKVMDPKRYVLSGIYQIPLFEGPFPNEFRKYMWTRDPW